MLPRGISVHQSKIGDSPRDNRPRANQRVTTNRYAAQQGRVRTDARAFAYQSGRVLVLINFRAWESIICKRDIGSDKNTVLKRNPLPQSNTIFHHYIISNHNTVFDKAMVAYVATRANRGTIEDMRECPNTRTFANATGFNQCGGMLKVTHRAVLGIEEKRVAAIVLRTRG